MGELDLIVLLTKWAMYVTAIATWVLRFIIPSPEEFVSIFGVTVAPHKYLVFYNIMRWVAGNKSYQERGPSTTVETVKVVPIPATETAPAMVATTTSVLEIKPDREVRTDKEKPDGLA